MMWWLHFIRETRICCMRQLHQHNSSSMSLSLRCPAPVAFNSSTRTQLIQTTLLWFSNKICVFSSDFTEIQSSACCIQCLDDSDYDSWLRFTRVWLNEEIVNLCWAGFINSFSDITSDTVARWQGEDLIYKSVTSSQCIVCRLLQC